MSGFRECVGVHAEEDWTANALLSAVVANGLGDGEDMIFVERGGGGASAVTGGTESDEVVDIARVGFAGIEVAGEAWEVDEDGFGSGFACQFADSHIEILLVKKVESVIEFLFKEFDDHLGVGLALAEFHDLSDEELNDLGVALAVLFDLGLVVGDGLIDEGVDGGGVGDLYEAFFFDDGFGVITGGEHIGEDGFGDFAVDLAFIDHVDHGGEPGWGDGALADGGIGGGEFAKEFGDDPVGG